MSVGRPFTRGASGNPQGRPSAPVDIAALAREHGPKCIAVLAEMLDDPNRKVRGFAAQVLLDRGFGRAPQTVQGQDAEPFTVMHLVAAREISANLKQILEARNGTAQPPLLEADEAGPEVPADLLRPALE
jgi:hypothetical protein